MPTLTLPILMAKLQEKEIMNKNKQGSTWPIAFFSRGQTNNKQSNNKRNFAKNKIIIIIITNNNQIDENVKKKKANYFYYGLSRHHINDCKHKKRVEKRNGTLNQANTIQSWTHTNVIVENEILKFF
jgi:hypothetical protein